VPEHVLPLELHRHFQCRLPCWGWWLQAFATQPLPSPSLSAGSSAAPPKARICARHRTLHRPLLPPRSLRLCPSLLLLFGRVPQLLVPRDERRHRAAFAWSSTRAGIACCAPNCTRRFTRSALRPRAVARTDSEELEAHQVAYSRATTPGSTSLREPSTAPPLESPSAARIAGASKANSTTWRAQS
jgi:hypothetical protein